MIFHINSKIRRFAIFIINKKWYDNTILILILINTIFLLIDKSFIDPNSSYAYFLSIIDDIFTFVFIIDMFLKIISFGLLKNNFKSNNITNLADIEEIKEKEENLKSNTDVFNVDVLPDIFMQPPYLRNVYNVINFLINITSIVCFYNKKEFLFTILLFVVVVVFFF